MPRHSPENVREKTLFPLSAQLRAPVALSHDRNTWRYSLDRRGEDPAFRARESAVASRGGIREVTLSFLQQDQQGPLVGDLYLSGGKLGEPLAKGLPFKEATGGKYPTLREGSFFLELPKLEKSVRMLLIVRSWRRIPTKVVRLPPFRLWHVPMRPSHRLQGASRMRIPPDIHSLFVSLEK